MALSSVTCNIRPLLQLKRAMGSNNQLWSMTMRADKDFRTYEQALTVVQRFGELAEADHENGKHKEAQYNLAHATFVGVKHLLFMAADAAIDRAEARELAAKNHLATVELLSLTLAALGRDDIDTGGDGEAPTANASKAARRAANAVGKSVKAAKTVDQSKVRAGAASKKPAAVAAAGRKSGLRERRR
ncbi:MAG TPA: hypothetical protein PLH23_15505 [Hyphomonadaceae bacterium]|nr:hypothetical protein [Hyphomonadaceae bacterium]HPI49679.1 hypothetical protein [Hyphomonadaceae bacterium]